MNKLRSESVHSNVNFVTAILDGKTRLTQTERILFYRKYMRFEICLRSDGNKPLLRFFRWAIRESWISRPTARAGLVSTFWHLAALDINTQCLQLQQNKMSNGNCSWLWFCVAHKLIDFLSVSHLFIFPFFRRREIIVARVAHSEYGSAQRRRLHLFGK